MFRLCIVSLIFCCSLNAQNLKNKTLPIPKDMFSKENIVYANNNGGEMLLDFYRPKNKKTVPVVVLVHGGGWFQGSRKTFQAMAVMLAEKGFAVANIDYRLSGESKFPGAIEDCKAAIRWVRANAKSYNLNSNKIFGIGGSAGGHIIAMSALTDEDVYEGNGGNASYSSKLQAAIILGSGVDQYKRALEAKNNTIRNCVTFFGEFKGNEAIYKEASPINHLTKGDPPIFMLDAELDRPGLRYVDFIEKMNSLNIPNTFDIIPDAKHGQWTIEPYRTNYINAFVKFLKTRK